MAPTWMLFLNSWNALRTNLFYHWFCEYFSDIAARLNSSIVNWLNSGRPSPRWSERWVFALSLCRISASGQLYYSWSITPCTLAPHGDCTTCRLPLARSCAPSSYKACKIDVIRVTATDGAQYSAWSITKAWGYLQTSLVQNESTWTIDTSVVEIVRIDCHHVALDRLALSLMSGIFISLSISWS